jgi:hypothetical protein
MASRTIWWLGAAGLVTASLALWKGSNGARGERTTTTAPEAAAAPSNDLGRLEGEIASLQRQLGADRLARARENAKPVEVREAAPEDEATAVAKKPHKEPTSRDIVSFLDDKFDDQAFDSSWSDGARATVSRVLASHLPPGSSLGHVECHTNICRIETRHGTLDQYREFMKSSFMTPDPGLWNGTVSTWVVDPDAPQPVAVTFIAREGTNLPPMPD